MLSSALALTLTHKHLLGAKAILVQMNLHTST